MDIAFLIVSIILIITAVLLFLKNSSGNRMMTKGQKIIQFARCRNKSQQNQSF